MLHELLLALLGFTGDFVIDEREQAETLGLGAADNPLHQFPDEPTFRLAPDLSFLHPSERYISAFPPMRSSSSGTSKNGFCLLESWYRMVLLASYLRSQLGFLVMDVITEDFASFLVINASSMAHSGMVMIHELSWYLSLLQ